MTKGKYIVLEGPEGVGKSTQILELSRRLQSAGLPVRTFREPDSQSDLTARAIRQLTQDPRYPMNTNTEVLLYNAARSQSLQIIKKSTDQGIICLVDRNYLTTLAIQYYGRGDVPDYETINNIIAFAVNGVEPDLCIVLDAPVPILRERLEKRQKGERFDNLDDVFLERVRAGYLWEARQRGLPVVFANEDSDTVANIIWQHVAATLANRNDKKVAADKLEALASVKDIIEIKQLAKVPGPSLDLDLSAIVQESKSIEQTGEPLVIKGQDGSFAITDMGFSYLSEIVTNIDGDVYAFTDKLNPVTIAAAMARLSRRGDDMRITILDEFATKLGKDEQLLKRVITAYGDDSVQQLAGQHFVIENASNLLTKKLEWGRLAAYLEQSTRYIYYDQKDSKGNYKYFIPEYLNVKVKNSYRTEMNTLFDLYSELVHKLTNYIQSNSKVPQKEQDRAWSAATRAQACDAARPVLPVATKSTVGVFASGQALESLIMHLLSDNLPEARITGERILTETRKVMPAFLERADNPERGGSIVAYRSNTFKALSQLSDKYLPPTYSVHSQPVTLNTLWPYNELDLIADMLYEHSNLSLESIQKEVARWSYKRKEEIFRAYMGERLNRRHHPGRALEKAHYSWDLVSDYGIFRDLQRHRIVDDLEWQALSPRYGFDIPTLVENANLSDLFEKCFAISLSLYSALQKAGYEQEAQYATLLGHKMRWKITYNAREAFHIHELRTSPQGHPGYRKLVQIMHDKLAEVHPLMAEAMKFVNQGEDPELTRLAAERYTQFKLQNLSTPK